MILLGWLGLLILYTVNQLHLPSDLGLPGLNALNLIFMLGMVLVILLARGPRLPKPSLSGPLKFYFAMMAIATLIAIWVRPMGLMADLTYLKTLVFYPLYYWLFYYAARDLMRTRLWLAAILFVAVVAGLEAWSEAISYGIGSYVESHRAAGPFGPDFYSANRAGVFYAMFLPMLLAPLLFLKTRPLFRLIALASVLILLGAILFTYSRQAYAIGLLGMALLAFKRGIGTATLGLVVFLIALPWLPQGATERVEETQQAGEYGQAQYDESTESRWILWEGGLAMWVENPFGIGANRFKSEIGNYSRYSGKDAHNYYVLTLAEAGWQGLLSLLWLVWAMWRLGGRLSRAAFDPESRALTYGFRVAVLAMMLGNIYGSPFSEGAIMGVFWALAGLMERYMHLRWQAAQAINAIHATSAGSKPAMAAATARKHR
ncbi:MAG: O-Antigen ligase [Alphaproteobacteria bacterium ADurb.BinA280]|jgi:hypothetical protein|nr:O-antigen ligase family protein [Xanthomonadales bacterium]MCC6505233.1 O-antigen ligase family protein [Aquimonas sp.]OPZ10417.1 MAG: O-Antigen ligase [Alphaproteobacteria bacterium ADurb.BinA280]